MVQYVKLSLLVQIQINDPKHRNTHQKFNLEVIWHRK